MNVFESIRIAVRALGANKLRTTLTMLGIIIGVGAVIALMSVGRGAQATITAGIQSMGTNLLFIRPASTQQGGVRTGQGTAPTLSYDDALAIADRVPTVGGVAPEQNSFAQFIAGPQNYNARLVGTSPEYEQVRNAYVASGEFITPIHMDARSTVVVLGATVAQTLFGELDPIDQTVKLSVGGRAGAGVNFRVIGVLERKGGTGFGNQDDQALIPLTTMQARLFGSRNTRGAQNVSIINVQIADESRMQESVELIGEVLRERHRTAQDDFTIQSQEDFLAVAGQITGVLTVLLGSIAGISLVVGGIGIMNIMLVSVTERTREIGIRKAVGAKRRDIMAQFLTEAVVVSVLGGALGIAIGMSIAAAISGMEFNGQRLQTLVAPEAVVMAFGVSAAIGLFFGIYPAARASRLHPIEALRYE